jgi:taurine dioxygenase
MHDAFGAEVLDFDLLPPTAPEDVEQLKRALDEYQILLFRNEQQVPPDRQVEITSWFGPATENDGDGRAWSVLHNDDDAGRRILPFHSDLTYTDSPVKIISLQATELPRGGSSTSFVSGIHAWATLPPERQRLLEGMTLRHLYIPNVSKVREGPQRMSDQPADVLQMPKEFVAEHPVRLQHPRTGQPVLFVTEYHADRIYEVDRAESDRLLGEILAHLYAPEHVYVHQWQLFDLLLWDNLAMQHARPEEAVIADGPRAMQRVALSDVTYRELIARALQAQKDLELSQSL